MSLRKAVKATKGTRRFRLSFYVSHAAFLDEIRAAAVACRLYSHSKLNYQFRQLVKISPLKTTMLQRPDLTY